MERPSRDHVLMEVANVFASRGTCGRARVGSAIARDGRVLATGYNGPPARLEHCSDSCMAQHIGGCSIAVHAESNAIAYAARYGISVDGATLYCTHLPCLNCAQLIINAGIIKVVYGQDYRDHSGIILLRQAGVDIMELSI